MYSQNHISDDTALTPIYVNGGYNGFNKYSPYIVLFYALLE